MSKEPFKRVVESILTADEFGPCPNSNLIAEYTDAQLLGNDVEKQYPEMTAHLQECPNCFEEYDELFNILKAEQKGELINPPRETDWDLSFLE